MKKDYLNQEEIIELIRLGKVKDLEEAILLGAIKVPEDLFNFQVSAFNEKGDSALHVAVRSGQAEVVRFLLTGLRLKDKANVWGFDTSVKNDKGEMPLDIVGSRNDQLYELIKFFLLTSNEEIIAKAPIPKNILPKIKEDISAPQNAHTYTGRKDDRDNVKDESALYIKIMEKIQEQRAQINTKRDIDNKSKDEFLNKAADGSLSEKDVQEYLANGGLIDCKTDHNNVKGGENALHLAIKGGHVGVVKMLLGGIEEKSGHIVGINFDSKAEKLLKEVMKTDSKNTKNYEEINNYLNIPKTTITHPAANPLREMLDKAILPQR